jgi:glycosyltransferase involved in cell wall biosynthesis
MACGLPPVVTPNTGAGDVIDEGTSGFMVPIRDSEAIADRLRYLYEHPDQREKMGKAARRAAEMNSWREYGSRLVRTLVEEE